MYNTYFPKPMCGRYEHLPTYPCESQLSDTLYDKYDNKYNTNINILLNFNIKNKKLCSKDVCILL